jgi:hypothetical protein
MEPQSPQNNTTPITQAPIIPESQMKFPDESAGGPPPPDTNRHGFNPWLIGLLVILLILLAVAVIWGEEIVGMILPEETAEFTLPPDTAEQSDADDLNALEAEIDDTDWSELDAEMDAIEAEINAEMEATSTAGTAN